jgi:hypothetical protein
VQDTPSAASFDSGLVAVPIGRCAKTSPWPPASLALVVAIGMWQMEHSFSISALTLGWSIVSRLTAACQYGSRAELAIIDARHDAPIETSSPDGVIKPLWQATQLSAVWNRSGAWPATGGCAGVAGAVCCA